MASQNNRLRTWLSPLVHLSNNWISLVGVVLVTTATILWLSLLPSSFRGGPEHPYIGIMTFLMLPGAFFLGLALIPLGIWLRFRKEGPSGNTFDRLPPLDFSNHDLRRLVIFVGVTSVLNVVIGSHFTYSAVTYMDSVGFCGKTCHTVMQPEFSAYQNSPHSRVECVSCHIGPGASWFVKSKLSGAGQLLAVTFNTYPRPIPTPVRNLRPARETCEACHWPQKFGEDRLRVIPKYAEDEKNTVTRTVLLMRIGGGRTGPGIHGAHLGPGIAIEYTPGEESRQSIPRVAYKNSATGQNLVFTAADAKPEALRNPTRVMDCMDCHNRPTHAYELPDRAMDKAMAAGDISPALPFAKKQGLELLKKSYRTNEEGSAATQAAFEAYFKQNYPQVYTDRRNDVLQGGKTLAAIYSRNIFPEMHVKWGTYPNNIGHTDFPGCFRCHDDNHAAADGKKITQDCNTCHRLLAMEEPSPKILTDLGLAEAAPPEKKGAAEAAK
jgi:hypothetical protein